MRQLYATLHVAAALLLFTTSVRAQDLGEHQWIPINPSPQAPACAPVPASTATPALPLAAGPAPTVVLPPAVVPAPVLPSALTPASTPIVAPAAPANLEIHTAEADLAAMQKKMEALNQQMGVVPAAALQDDKLKAQVELLQKQMEVQQKMIQLLLDTVKKQPMSSSAVEALQTQTATLESRGKQAAQRDQELAQQVDSVVEHQDAVERYGPQLPAQLKELFLSSGNNESPLSIYGALAFGYSKFVGDPATAANGAGRPSTPGGFYFGEFTPDFLLKLNDWILLEAEIGIGGDGSVSAGSFAQADFFVNDSLTIIAGRYVTPIGFFNERLNNPWVNKLPGDAPGSGPLLWQQVLPAFSMLGVQAAGAFYLFNSPIKMEYNVYLGNGLNFTPATAGAPTVSELANLENMESTFTTVTNSVAVGGRVGLWWPELGLAAGFSAFHNPDYIAGFNDAMNIFAVDFNYHMGDWDFRAEFGRANQQAQNVLGNDITREGFYTQLAYRPWEASCQYVQNLEFVYRYSYANFKGIDAAALDLTTFSTPADVPVRRQQNEMGVNYYFYQRMLLKIAYQINDEPGFHLHDNQFITELAWGW
jgi:hypothetical protein